jgi:hypothetical protein
MSDLQSFKNKIKKLYKDEKPFIYKTAKGYTMFGIYDIIKDDSVYSIYRHGNYIDFANTQRSAVSWCVADHSKEWDLANELIRLDHLVANRRFDIEVHKKQSEKKTGDDKKLHVDLYIDCIIRLQEAKSNLDKCIQMTKYSNKIKDFKNESK